MPTEINQDLLARIAELERRLAESEETLRAIRSGEVDALVAAGPDMLAAEQLSRSILEQAAEAVMVLDATGTILRASETANRLAGKNVLHQDFDSAFRLISPVQDSDPTNGGKLGVQELLTTVRSGGVLRSVELTLTSPTGPWRTVLLSAGPLWNGPEDLRGCVVTLTDITERKQAEEALARQADELVRSNADLQQFAYVTSHDLQEPLRSIASYAQLLKRRYQSQLGSDADEFIEFIVSGVQRMKSLIDALLSFSRVVNVETTPFGSVEMEGALLWACMNLQIVIEESKAVITNDPLPIVRGDQVMLVQLFQNLIGNSIKYRGKEFPEIHISASSDGRTWEFSVTDNGIGIDPQYHERIFGVFKRLHGREIPGTGIGLAICQRILQKHGGKIWVESRPGAGSVFKFTIPADN